MAQAHSVDTLRRVFQEYLEHPRTLVRRSFDMADSAETVLSNYRTTTPEATLQGFFRPVFGKAGFVEPQIGHHPDFVHLQTTPDKTESWPIVTLFLDMVNSTRLGIIYKPDDVFRIKNAILRAAIDIATAFDGHVHRIMGDAIMVFFGGKAQNTEASVINAINAACSIQFFVKREVVPQLQAGFGEEAFGIRIGLDYAPQEKIVWGCYGYAGVNEVTATSFHVDAAAKLQHAAGKNQIMIGQSLKEHIDFPEDLLKLKTQVSGGESDEVPYLMPNYSDANGWPINYRQYLLEWETYLRYTPISQHDANYRELDALAPAIQVCDVRHSELGFPYLPCSDIVPKKKHLKFKVNVPFTHVHPKISYTVENHGAEAALADNYGNHKSEYGGPKETATIGETHEHWESTLYKGLQFMTIRLFSDETVTHETRLGIFIA